MDRPAQIDLARRFRTMHDRTTVLLLPNAWDAGSARLFAQRGFAAVATTSGGVAWSLGYADGEQAPLAEVLAAIGRITRVTSVPVTVDIERGYGKTLAAVARTVEAVIETGAVGINLEDGLGDELRPCDEAAERIDAARRAATTAGVPIVINARIDCWLQQPSAGAACFDDAVRRARAYLAAGADCIYPIGLGDSATLDALIKTIDAPVNVGARPGLPDMAALARLGVARVSTATRLATIALGTVDRAARALLESGSFNALDTSLSHADMQRMFTHA